MQISVVAAGFSPEEADRLHRSLTTFRRMGTISSFRDRFVQGMLDRDYEFDFAKLEVFAEYGFPDSHPAVFACTLLNSQPMGFYAPAQIVRDAREHQVDTWPICVNHSA